MNPIELYQQIAEAYHNQAKYQERDRFLVLALDAAQHSGQGGLAEQLRQRLLELNPNHLIKPFPNCATALQSPNFINYVSQLRNNFPPAKAQSLLQELSGATGARPKRTMMAESTFPMANPVDERKTPIWSQVNVDVKSKQNQGPSIGVYNVTEPLTLSANDPLANVPVSPQPPVPFKLAKPARKAPEASNKTEIIPAPRSSKSNDEIVSPGGAWVGNLLFLVLFLASIAALAYIFVLPFYPEVAKVLKPGS